MNELELISCIQRKLSSKETVIALHEANMMEGWVRCHRILGLIRNGNSTAFFIFNITSPPPEIDVEIEWIIPVDANFKCDIDTQSESDTEPDLLVNIISKSEKYFFEMTPGLKTSNFVGEIYRVSDDLNKKRHDYDFFWVNKYRISNKQFDTNNGEVDSLTDNSLPRDTIAVGTTAIANRESVIRYKMLKKENDYMYDLPIKIFIGTWNVNGQAPVISLTEWLINEAEPPDIYAVGFQELDLSKEAFVFNETPREEEWLIAVQNGLHPSETYHKVALVRLVGMMLIIFIKKSLLPYLKGVSEYSVGTGIMGKMGNKGGVAVRMDLHTTSICFVNSHFAAHVEEYERRNQDYRGICARTIFTKFSPPKSIKDHDQIYWLGDLNYRITDLDPHFVKDCIENYNFKLLLEHDQLVQQRKLKNVFIGYEEGVINFKPTYKYDMGTDSWDSSEKNRAPAWCDRILWKGDKIKQLFYGCQQSIKISDHKPVNALFESKIRVIDTVKYRKVHEDVMKKLDKLENEFLPQVMVDKTEIIFGVVRFMELQFKDLIVANTGQVPVNFKFIRKLDDPNYCKEWLNIEPYMGEVMPGEKCDIKLEICVDKKSAHKLNCGIDQLYDILVLHLEGGKDLFITVTGSYERSCFGCSIEALVHMKTPIKEVSLKELIDLETKKKPDLSTLTSIPKEIWFLVDYLYRNALKQHDLFEQPGLQSEIIQIRNWLDSGSQEPLKGGIHSVAEVLLLLLDSTPEPLIPYKFHAHCLNVANNFLMCKEIIEQLSLKNRNVFLYLCLFLQELLSHSNENNIDAKSLAALFGAIFLRGQSNCTKEQTKISRQHQQIMDRKKASFVYQFFTNDLTDLIMSCS